MTSRERGQREEGRDKEKGDVRFWGAGPTCQEDRGQQRAGTLWVATWVGASLRHCSLIKMPVLP